MALSIELEQTPKWWRLSVKGELDYGGCSTLRLSLHRILQSKPSATIVDLSELSHIDSSGLGQLLAMSKEYQALGGSIVLVTNELVNEILRLARIDRLFVTASSPAAAMGMIDTGTS